MNDTTTPVIALGFLVTAVAMVLARGPLSRRFSRLGASFGGRALSQPFLERMAWAAAALAVVFAALVFVGSGWTGWTNG